MPQPQFTWWPWKLLALAVPVMASIGLGMALAQAPDDVWKEQLVFWGVLSAGNGYLMAIANGDFGRSALAVPIGVLTSYLGCLLLTQPWVACVYLLLVLVIVGLAGPWSKIVCLLLCIIAAPLLFYLKSYLTPIGWLNLTCYPFVCGCIAASMPVEATVRSVFSALAAGTSAAVTGMVAATAGFAVGNILVLILEMFMNTAPYDQLPLAVRIPAMAGPAAMAANYVCLGQLFKALERTRAEKAPE